MEPHTKPAGRPCRHRSYWLSCEDFDRLRARALDRCEICGTRGSDTGHGELHIDHDPALGDWAVRGLLCSRCNTSLHRLDSDAARAYLANPWHGDVTPVRLEPPVGSKVVDLRGYTWKRLPNGKWRSNSGHRGSAMTWLLLNKRFGPHNLRLARENGIEPARPGPKPR